MKARSLLTTLGLSLAVLSSVALPAQAETKTLVNGPISAEVSYDPEPDSRFVNNVRIQISRQGQTLLDAAVPESNLVVLAARGEVPVEIQDLDADGEPEVILDLYTGGAHCCTVSNIYRYLPDQNTYQASTKDWRDYSYRRESLNGDAVPEFVSADPRFAYQFTSFAGSGVPVQIWNYRAGRWTDVTRQYPARIYNDAFRWWQSFERVRRENPNHEALEVRGVLAAYMADKYLLGQEEDGWRRLRQVYRYSDREQYFGELRSFLRETGYAR